MSHDLYESVVGPLWVRDGCLYQFTGPERTRRGGKVLVVDAERRQRGATAGPRSTSVADPTRRASGPRYGSVSRARSGSRDTSAADPARSTFAMWDWIQLNVLVCLADDFSLY